MRKEDNQFGNLCLLNHLYKGKSITEKEAPRVNTIQNGRKIKKAKIKVSDNIPKKKYFSIIFGCI